MKVKNTDLALHTAGCIAVYLFKKGGNFPTPEIAKVIQRECLDRLAKRLTLGEKRNNKLAKAVAEGLGSPRGQAYAQGSAFGFAHSARIARGEER